TDKEGLWRHFGDCRFGAPYGAAKSHRDGWDDRFGQKHVAAHSGRPGTSDLGRDSVGQRPSEYGATESWHCVSRAATHAVAEPSPKRRIRLRPGGTPSKRCTGRRDFGTGGLRVLFLLLSAPTV